MVLLNSGRVYDVWDDEWNYTVHYDEQDDVCYVNVRKHAAFNKVFFSVPFDNHGDYMNKVYEEINKRINP